MATKLKIFHISFRSYLQEQVLPKLKKPPLVHSDEWEDDNDEKVNVNDDAGMAIRIKPYSLFKFVMCAIKCSS